jgi:hypothetical protein
VVFPETLNLNSFVPINRNMHEGLEERDPVVRCDECSTTDSGSALDDESCQGTDLSSTVNDHDDNCEDSDEGKYHCLRGVQLRSFFFIQRFVNDVLQLILMPFYVTYIT